MFESLHDKIVLMGGKLAGAIRSKTIWLNALFLVFLDKLPSILGNVAVSLPELQPYLGTVLYHNVALLLIIGNMYLRFRTKTPLESK